MNTKLFAAVAGAALLIASTAGANIVPGQYAFGTVTGLDAQAKTITVDGKTYSLLGQMPDVRVGERGTIAHLGNAGWFTPEE